MSDKEIAKCLGEARFAGVKDKAGQPYWEHCERVAARVNHLADAAVGAALLHDIIEDGLATEYDLIDAGLSSRCIDLIKKLSRPRDGSTYMDYIRGIATSGDDDLVQIKLADNADNSTPWRIEALPEAERSIVKRYATARKILLGGKP